MHMLAEHLLLLLQIWQNSSSTRQKSSKPTSNFEQGLNADKMIVTKTAGAVNLPSLTNNTVLALAFDCDFR